MKKENDKKKKRWYLLGIVLAAILLASLVLTSWSVWQEYSTAIMDRQKEQMSITVDFVASSLEHEMKVYKEDVDNMMNAAVYGQENSHLDYIYHLLEQYISNKAGYVSSMVLRDAQGNTLWAENELVFSEVYNMSDMGADVILSERKASDGELYFVFTKKDTNGMLLELDVLIEGYYNDMLSDIKIGTNGYVVLKTSNGIILMHPEEEQWGLDVIEGRQELYHTEELQSLQEMTEKQLAGETGVAEYISYWWGNPDLPKVKKIAAYTPAYVGDDYLVVSAVIDYDDLYEPVFGGFIKIGATFFGLLLLVLGILAVVTYLAFQRKKNQEEIEYLKDLNEVLEETRQSEEAITHQQRLQIMGTMTGGIAHEFNNMLTPVMGYADMLLDKLSPTSEEYEYAQEIFDASDRAKDVIQQISSLSRKNMETVFSFISVKKLLTRTLKMIYSVCPANVRLSLDEVFKKEGFLGNETQMKQVLLNLCVNAFHAMGKEKAGILNIYGMVEEREHIESYQQIQMAKEWEKYICIRVSDNGCGMNAETMEQIFTPFFTTKATGKGTGLGLSVVEQIIHSHKGYICVKSNPGRGTDFYIYLPLTEEKQKRQIEKGQPKQGHLKILVVDDNEKILQLLKKEFAGAEIDVFTAETPKNAKKVLEEKTFQVLLIDRTLAENHSGINFAMSIKNKYPDMLKILMVDQVKKEVIEAVQQKIVDAYVEKPVSGIGIIEKIRELEVV